MIAARVRALRLRLPTLRRSGRPRQLGADFSEGDTGHVFRLEVVPYGEMEEGGIKRARAATAPDLRVVRDTKGPIVLFIRAVEDALVVLAPEMQLGGTIRLNEVEETAPSLEPLPKLEGELRVVRQSLRDGDNTA